jgi:hypothetical protein
MTDTLTTPPPREPGQVRRSWLGDSPPLPVTCRHCGHATHYAACDVRLSWWRRLWLRREFCSCSYG